METPSPPHLSQPPRALPVGLQIRVVMGRASTQIGWAVVAVGLLFSRIFGAGEAVSSTLRLAVGSATAQGVTTGWRETNFSINETRVIETTFEFEAGARRVVGSSYATGSHLPTGQVVTVEYLPSDPGLARIQGMRTTQGGLGTSFLLLFPGVGAALVVFGTRRGLKARRLMRTGRLALGTLQAKEPTKTSVNDQTVYKLTFGFDTPAGPHQVTTRTHRPWGLEDEARERLVYDPRDPSEATLLDDLPCRPGVDARGDFVLAERGGTARALRDLAIPILTLGSYAAYTLLFG